MSKKSYAFFDLLGVREAIENGDVHELLEKFWNSADAWTNSSDSKFRAMNVVGDNYVTSPEIFCASFTDSLVMHTSNDHGPDNFYQIVQSLKDTIEQSVGPCYVVISYANEISQPAMPALGGSLTTSNGIPRYYKLAGSGESWANMMYADHAVTKKKEWHGKYSVYCVGDQALPQNVQPIDSTECKTLNGIGVVHAIA